MGYPLNYAEAHAIPSLLTGYPQVPKFSGDDVLFSRSDVLYLSMGNKKKDGSIDHHKRTWDTFSCPDSGGRDQARLYTVEADNN